MEPGSAASPWIWPNKASETDGVLLDDRENSAKVNQDSDYGDNEDTADWERRTVNQERSERKGGHHQCAKQHLFHIKLRELNQSWWLL